MADTEVTDLTELTTPVASDVMLIVDDPGGTPISKKMTLTNLATVVAPVASLAKFWVAWTANSTTILASYNMDSIADTAVGDADGTITTDFAGTAWCGVVTTKDATANGWDANSIQSSGFNARAAGTFGVLCGLMIDGSTAVGNLIDPEEWHVIGFGAQ